MYPTTQRAEDQWEECDDARYCVLKEGRYLLKNDAVVGCIFHHEGCSWCADRMYTDPLNSVCTIVSEYTRILNDNTIYYLLNEI